MSEFIEKFPELVHFIDGVELHLVKPGGHIMWCSDWARIWDLPLRREYGGPATYGHVSFFLEDAS
jgi:hypothetical protein